MDNISTKVYWEKNTLVNGNNDISNESVFARCPTRDFPYGAVSVRINNQSKGTATVYFRDEVKTKSYSEGHSYEYCDSELKVTLPLKSNWSGLQYNYSMQGTLPRKYDLISFARILDYVRCEIEKMSGVAYNDIPQAHV